MRKLLSANMARLWRSKIFWTLEIAVVIWGIIAYSLVVINTQNLGMNWLMNGANIYFYHAIMYSAIVLAIFCSQFFGTEYEYGTIRNKLSVGQSRKNVYLSNLMISFLVSVIFTISHMATSFVAVPFVGIEAIIAANHTAWRFLCWFLIAGVYAALFTMLAILDSSKSRNTLLSLLLALVLSFVGFMVYSKLAEPESVSRWVANEAGQFVLEENILNPDYLRGTIRTVFEWLDMVMPSSQGMHIMDANGEFHILMPICSVCLIILLTTLGINLFKRKDIK